jgi:hypothetical protein
MSKLIVCPNCRHEIPIAEAVEHAIEDRLGHERSRLLEAAQTQARDLVAGDVRDLQQQLHDASELLRAANELEIQLRRERRELEDRERQLQVDAERRLDEERARIREEAVRNADESHRLKESDHLKHIDDLRKQIGELKRKAEQGSTASQGEVMEIELEELLRMLFPHDELVPVPVGVHGGDLLQRVRDSQGLPCGSILWESKRTKTWKDDWLPKLRDDQAACNADLSAILTAQLPKGLANFGGVWVTNRSCLPGLAAALRSGVVDVARARRSLDGRSTKADHLVGYLCSTTFRLTIEGIVETYRSLKEDLNLERRTHQRLWLKRERLLERAIGATGGILGEISVILGSDLPTIDVFDAETALAVPESDDASPF